MVNTIVHHAFPTRLELLFAFEFTGNNQNKGTYFIRIVVIEYSFTCPDVCNRLFFSVQKAIRTHGIIYECSIFTCQLERGIPNENVCCSIENYFLKKRENIFKCK